MFGTEVLYRIDRSTGWTLNASNHSLLYKHFIITTTGNPRFRVKMDFERTPALANVSLRPHF